ncbi:MAG TPA: hypothetical protein VFW85_06345 [Gaiellaceae bacterium]|nr:hypothetical protein [Gaiellaceae bacterium]
MAARKPSPAQQRDRRAKIMLAVLGVVLVIVLGVQLPKLLGGSKNAADTAPPVAPAAAATSTTPASASFASAPTQLQRFTRFAAKDPFKAGYTPPAGASSTTPTTTNPDKKPLTINITESAPSVSTVPAALMMVNGKKHVVALGAVFPKKSPMFRIVALSQKSIWIELVAGSFPNGKQTLKIDRGSKVTLDNVTADLKFVLGLVKPTTAPAPVKKTP